VARIETGHATFDMVAGIVVVVLDPDHQASPAQQVGQVAALVGVARGEIVEHSVEGRQVAVVGGHVGDHHTIGLGP